MSDFLGRLLHRDGARKAVYTEAEQAAALAEGWGLHRIPPPSVEVPVQSDGPPTVIEKIETGVTIAAAVLDVLRPKKRGRPKK